MHNRPVQKMNDMTSCSIAIDRMIGFMTIGAFEINCALIATAAVSLASFVYLAVRDQNGASLILIGTAGMLAILMCDICKSKAN
jgi:hypothetical protein